jgi:hypothetical protein
MRDEIPKYRVTPRANEGAARETTIPESKADGTYVLRYCPLIKGNVFVQEKDSETSGLRDYVIWANHSSAKVGFDQWKEISTNYSIEAQNGQVFMLFSAKVDRFRDAVNIEEKKTESDSAKKAQKPERASAVAAMRERTDESKSTLPAQKVYKSAVAASTQASEPAQDEKVYKSAVAASTQASEPAQDEKVYKSAVAASTQASEPAQQEKNKSAVAAMTQASEPAQDEKMNMNNVISKAKKAEEDFSEITEEDNKEEDAAAGQHSIITKSKQSKTGLKTTYRDAMTKPDAQFDLEKAHECVMLQLTKYVNEMVGVVREGKKRYVLQRAEEKCQKYIKALDDISQGLQAEYRKKYGEKAVDSIWDLIDKAYAQRYQESDFMSEGRLQADMQDRTALASIESESMSGGAATSIITTENSSQYSVSSKTYTSASYTSSTQSGRNTVHHDAKPVRKPKDRKPMIAQPATGPYVEEQLERFVNLVFDCLDPMFVPCNSLLAGVAALRRLYLVSAQGVNAREHFERGDQAVFEYHKENLFKSKKLEKQLILNNEINPDEYMCMAALEIATCLYINMVVEGIESRSMDVTRKINGITHWIGRIPRSTEEIGLLAPLVHKIIDELKSKDVGHCLSTLVLSRGH